MTKKQKELEQLINFFKFAKRWRQVVKITDNVHILNYVVQQTGTRKQVLMEKRWVALNKNTPERLLKLLGQIPSLRRRILHSRRNLSTPLYEYLQCLENRYLNSVEYLSDIYDGITS